jgi:hypothetical protein
MKIHLIAALLCLCLMPSQSAHASEEIPPIDFKGLMLGEDMRTAFTKLPDLADDFDRFLAKSPDGTILLHKQNPRITLAKAKIEKLYVRFIPLNNDDTTTLQTSKEFLNFSALSAAQKLALARARFYSVAAIINQSDYERVRDALIAKHGAPHARKTRDLQNRMGASFTSEECSWIFSGTVVTITEREGSIDTSRYFIFCASLAPPKVDHAPINAKDL